MKTDENSPADWMRSARSRLRSVDILHAVEGATEAVVELLQEVAERNETGPSNRAFGIIL